MTLLAAAIAFFAAAGAAFPQPATAYDFPKLKLEKLSHYDGKSNPELWVMLYETACRSAMGDEHVMANYFPIVVGPVGH